MCGEMKRRIAALDWLQLQASLDETGYAVIPGLLGQQECEGFVAMYDDESRFRSRIDMARYRFGAGEYKYFQHPLPPLLCQLREALYPELAAAANRWLARLGGGEAAAYPARLQTFIERCRRHGQIRPTPLILKYEQGGYNCLHQDMYGEVFFPFQVVTGLSRYGIDYTGGQFLLVEQRPRAQSRGHAIALEQGDGLIFPTRHRPAAGTRGYYRATLRHGVSTVTAGRRFSLGIIFHDGL